MSASVQYQYQDPISSFAHDVIRWAISREGLESSTVVRGQMHDSPLDKPPDGKFGGQQTSLRAEVGAVKQPSR